MKTRKSLEQQALRTFLYAEGLIFMPTKPKRPCKHPGCPRLTGGRYCELHAKLHINDRENAFERGYNSLYNYLH